MWAPTPPGRKRQAMGTAPEGVSVGEDLLSDLRLFHECVSSTSWELKSGFSSLFSGVVDGTNARATEGGFGVLTKGRTPRFVVLRGGTLRDSLFWFCFLSEGLL